MNIKKITPFIYLLGAAVAVTGLAFFAYLGYYNRYWSDDWCYNRDYKNLGVIRTIGLFFATGDEASRGWPLNRYSQTTLEGLSYLPGIIGTQILPALTIVLWLVVLFWVISNASRMFNYEMPRMVRLLISALILFYNLYISTDRFQILYWRSGVIPYSYTLIFGLILLGIITDQALNKRSTKINVLLAATAGFIGGGLSEIGSAFLLSSLSLVLGWAWIEKRAGKPWAMNAYSVIQAAWFASLFALIALAISPANSRYETTQRAPTSVSLIPYLSLRSAIYFILFSLKDLPLPHGIFLATFVSLSIFHASTSENSITEKKALLTAALTGVVALLLITAIQAPTTYLYSSPPDPRGQSLSRFTMLTGLALIAWNIGSIMSKRLSKHMLLVVAAVILVGYAYTARAVISTFNELPGFVHRAQLWDERDRMIREEVENGVVRLEVPVIDTQEIGTKDIMRSRDMNRWVNNCAAGYYGLQEIKAISP